MKIFTHGINASGKTFNAQKHSKEEEIPYISFDGTWNYTYTPPKSSGINKCKKYLDTLPTNFAIDAIPFDDSPIDGFSVKGGLLETFYEWEYYQDDVKIIVVFCSNKEEWIERLKNKSKQINNKIVVKSFIKFQYLLNYNRILQLKNKNILYYDTYKEEYIDRKEYIKRIEWVEQETKENYENFNELVLNKESLEKIIKSQKYDWDYQDIEILNIVSGFKTYKSWENIKDLVEWKNKRVVDIGCNHGYMCLKAENNGAKVIGLDKDIRKIKIAKLINHVSHNSVSYKSWRSGEDIPKCDIILCLNVLHHIKNPKETFDKMNCKQIIFEIKKAQIPLVKKYFNVIKTINSHRGGRIILLCSKKHNTTAKNIKELLQEKRMSLHKANTGNSLHDMYKMIKEYYKDNFTVIEIGGFEGASTELFALMCKKVYSIDPYDKIEGAFDSKILIERLKEAEKIFIERFKNYKNVIKIKNFSWDEVNKFKDESIDAIYIDGNHDFFAVLRDIAYYFPKIKTNGIISGHDYYGVIIEAINKTIGDVIKHYDDGSWVAIKDEKTIKTFNNNIKKLKVL